jgi:catechol 2,3-dioxygenase-like lactoylglutathione lyase family enzyme
VLFVVVASVIMQVDGGVSQFAKRIRSPLQREAAACEALRLADSGLDDKCAVNHVIETVGPQGKTTFVVFFRHDWGGGGPGKPVGHFEVFDDVGLHIKWFMNANVLEPTDSVLQLGKGQCNLSTVKLVGRCWREQMNSIETVTIGLGVKSTSAAVAWYQKLLGNVEVLEPAPGTVELRLNAKTWLQLDDTGYLAVGGGSTIVRFSTDDVERSHQFVKTIAFKVSDIETVDGVIRYFDFEDPSGNRLSYYQLM